MQNVNRDFKGVWIPKDIWIDTNLGWSEKLLLVEIDSLNNENGCFASNEYFAKFFGLSKDRISKMISDLTKKGYINCKIIYKDGTKQIEKRIIRTTIGYSCKQLEGIVENNDRGIVENNEDNNTDNSNNTINNSNNKQSFDFSFIDTEILESVMDFIEFRKSIKKRFVSQIQLEKFYKQLMKYANNKTDSAKKIIDNSITNGWQGIFELKNTTKNGTYSESNRYSIKREDLTVDEVLQNISHVAGEDFDEVPF